MVVKFPIDEVIEILVDDSSSWSAPVDTLVKLQKGKPFFVLIATIVSLRTRDEVTIEVAKRLFLKLSKPTDIFKLSISELEKLIYPCGFYRNKAKQIDFICRSLIKDFNCVVPNDIDVLVKFPGVGRKTANLVLAEGFGLFAMCVDVHVHRISNRLGYIRTKNPDESEVRLRLKLDKKYWGVYNQLLVGFGQTICKSVSPKCSICLVNKCCKKIGVKVFR